MLQKFFSNKQGQLIIWQFPNPPLVAGIACSIVAMVAKGRFHSGLQALATASFFAWSYLELRYGESMFRRLLGAVVMLSIIASYFMQAGR